MIRPRISELFQEKRDIDCVVSYFRRFLFCFLGIVKEPSVLCLNLIVWKCSSLNLGLPRNLDPVELLNGLEVNYRFCLI